MAALLYQVLWSSIRLDAAAAEVDDGSDLQLFTLASDGAEDMVSGKFNFRVQQQHETFLLAGAHHMSRY